MTTTIIPLKKSAKWFASRELSLIEYKFTLYRIIDIYREPVISNLRKIGVYTSIRDLPKMSRQTLSQMFTVEA